MDIEFDDTKLDREWIKEWSRYIYDLDDKPIELCSDTVSEESIPFFNLAKTVGYSVAVNQDDHVEGLQFYPNCYKGINPERDAETAVFYEIVSVDTGYEFDLENSQCQ